MLVQNLYSTALKTRIRVAAKFADWCGMIIFIHLLFVMACTQTPLPNLRIPADTVVMRESFQGPGPERTGNWWGRFDANGCWWEAHNTWLIVSDEVLLSSPAHPLHWNAIEPANPWFCLSEIQFLALKDAIDAVEPTVGIDTYAEAVDRWTVVRNDGIHTLVKKRGYRNGGWEGLTDFFEIMASVHVWGQSPE